MWSFTQLSTLESCPYKWKRVYLDGVRQPPTRETALGTWVHEAIRTLEPPEKALEKGWNAMKDEERALLDPERDVLEALRMVETAVRARPAGVRIWSEQEFRHTIPAEVMARAGSPSPRDEVVMGRIDEIQDGERWELFDYKTGRWTYTPSLKDWQLPLYGLLWAEVSDPRPIILTNFFLRTGERLSWEVRSIRELAPVWKKVVLLIVEARRREAERDFPATPNQLCAWCHLKAECPAWKARVDSEPLALPSPVSDEAEARELAERVLRLEETLEMAKARLEEWVRNHGTLEAAGQWFGIFPRRQTEVDPGLFEAMKRLGIDPLEAARPDARKARELAGLYPDLEPYVREEVKDEFRHRKSPPSEQDNLL